MRENLIMTMLFQIEAKSERSKENMKNKIKKQLENILGKLNILLEYDEETNSFCYIQEDVKESFDEKVILLIKTSQKFGYSYVITGNLENKEFDICTSKAKLSGVSFIQGQLFYQNEEEEV